MAGLQGRMLFVCMLFLGPSPVSTVTNTSQMSYVEGKEGTDVTFSWQVPQILHNIALVVHHHQSDDNVNNTLFILPRVVSESRNPNMSVLPNYANRIAFDKTAFSQGVVKFTLRNVSSQDAGSYVCKRGLTVTDDVDGCGQTLILIGAPVNASISVHGAMVSGQNVTLWCTASSTTQPRDLNRPKKYRWFEAERLFTREEHHNHWMEIKLDPITPSDHLNISDDEDYAGSGDDGPEVPNVHSYSMSNYYTIVSLQRRDEGRRFACSVSEGLGLWSHTSHGFKLRPEWKPLPSDMTLTPKTNSTILMVGDSSYVNCSAECRPHCHITWLKVVHGNAHLHVSKSATLSLHHVHHNSEGTYKCHAHNAHGSASLHWHLKVKGHGKPWFRNTGYIILVVVGTTVIVALLMTAIAVVVIRCRRHTFIIPHRRLPADNVILSEERNHGRTDYGDDSDL